MTTFWNAFVWGIGATVGGSIGMMLFVVLFGLWKMVTQSKAMKKAEQIAELSLVALDTRNELTRGQIAMLERIASAAEGLENAR